MCKTQLRRYVKLPPRAVLAPDLGPSEEKGWKKTRIHPLENGPLGKTMGFHGKYPLVI